MRIPCHQGPVNVARPLPTRRSPSATKMWRLYEKDQVPVDTLCDSSMDISCANVLWGDRSSVHHRRVLPNMARPINGNPLPDWLFTILLYAYAALTESTKTSLYRLQFWSIEGLLLGNKAGRPLLADCTHSISVVLPQKRQSRLPWPPTDSCRPKGDGREIGMQLFGTWMAADRKSRRRLPASQPFNPAPLLINNSRTSSGAAGNYLPDRLTGNSP